MIGSVSCNIRSVARTNVGAHLLAATVMSGLATFDLRLSPLHLSFGVSVRGYLSPLSRSQEVVKLHDMTLNMFFSQTYALALTMLSMEWYCIVANSLVQSICTPHELFANDVFCG